MNEKRSFSPEQTMQIIREAEEIGPSAVCRKYEITHRLFNKWENQAIYVMNRYERVQ